MKTRKTITTKVIPLREIPEDFTKDLDLLALPKNKFIYIEAHVDESDEEELEWFEENYPELVHESSFLVQIDI